MAVAVVDEPSSGYVCFVQGACEALLFLVTVAQVKLRTEALGRQSVETVRMMICSVV